MGVFDAFSGKEQMSAAEIAAEVGADRVFLGKKQRFVHPGDYLCLMSIPVRLMRALLVNNIFEEVGEEQYAQNALSKTFSNKALQTFLLGM